MSNPNGLSFPAAPAGTEGNWQYIHADAQAVRHIDAYIEYRQIVGDTDGGRLLSEEEFNKRKRQFEEAKKHRAYVSWRNMNTGIDCKLIGSESKCMCGHKWKEHLAPYKPGAKFKCRVPGCKCCNYDYLPSTGTWVVRCLCKHTATDHDPRTKACTKRGCGCEAFYSRFTCSCGEYWEAHKTVIEGQAEREASGRAVNKDGAAPAGMGGLTSLTSLVDGAERQQYEEDLLIMPPAGKKKMSEADEMAAMDQLYKRKQAAEKVSRGRPRPVPVSADPADRMQWTAGTAHSHSYGAPKAAPKPVWSSNVVEEVGEPEVEVETDAQRRLRKRREIMAKQREQARARAQRR
ncbi:hypothetical protein J8273_5092 [Carpediemonas membranifera]|uniref:Protein FAM221A n=1 Tax=Carpediemonas membranifera TaxID=201153 RepID=A0A8J6ARH2_9EUKA|nr:hypothetical protein J8273_5092 [Carpediemonas membranifera]|eukprot:KAG9392113.1 hypothetical protein J8273_5092 [Carpediemonas membranifera]